MFYSISRTFARSSLVKFLVAAPKSLNLCGIRRPMGICNHLLTIHFFCYNLISRWMEVRRSVDAVKASKPRRQGNVLSNSSLSGAAAGAELCSAHLAYAEPAGGRTPPSVHRLFYFSESTQKPEPRDLPSRRCASARPAKARRLSGN